LEVSLVVIIDYLCYVTLQSNFTQSERLKITDNIVDQLLVSRRFYNEHNAQGRSVQFNSRFGIRVESAVYYIGPLYQLGHRFNVEAELFSRYLGNEFSARAIARIVELLARFDALRRLLKMYLILFC